MRVETFCVDGQEILLTGIGREGRISQRFGARSTYLVHIEGVIRATISLNGGWIGRWTLRDANDEILATTGGIGRDARTRLVNEAAKLFAAGDLRAKLNLNQDA